VSIDDEAAGGASSAGPDDEAGRSGSSRRAWWGGALLLAVLAFVPALIAEPGRMPADSKLYLYLDPWRFLADAAGTFDPRQFAGWVPHQHVSYLWPAGPWYALFDAIGFPDWIAHRLWIGTILVVAGLGTRWCARQLGFSPVPALAAALVYQMSLYIWPYVSRTSVMLLPWAGLGWVVGLTIRATRRGGWRDPALIALVVLTVGAVNATALAMIVPAPVVWLLHAGWARLASWRQVALVAARSAVLSLAVSIWWIVALVVQGRYGAEVLPYSESLADVSLTATSAEVWRGLGYWLFYIRDPAGATTTESLRYLTSTPAIAISYAVPILCLLGLVWTRWVHRRFAALLVVTGAVLAVGVHPVDDRSPLMRLLTGDADGGLALALRSSTRALPVMNLGLALSLAALVAACSTLRWRAWRLDRALFGVTLVLLLLDMPGLWNGSIVDPTLERDERPPAAWQEATADLDIEDAAPSGRVLVLPGAEFGAYRWGYTVDQPLPGLTERAIVTRDLLPLGSAPAMDLLYAFDDRFQDGVAEPASLDTVARLFAADTVWLVNDLDVERFRTARPEVVRDVVLDAGSVVDVDRYGTPRANHGEVPMIDERALGDPRVGADVAPVELVHLDVDGGVARAYDRTVLVAGSGAGVVDAAASGLLPADVGIRYAADAEPSPSDVGVIVTDSNRDRARHWRSSQDTTGFTESGGPDDDLLRPAVGDARLPVFADADPADQTVALQRGPVTAIASAYGEPFAYLPEHRALMAIDGDPSTSWLVGEHGDPIGESIELSFPTGSPSGSVRFQQLLVDGRRRIGAIRLVEGTEGGLAPSTERVVELDGGDAGTVVPIASDTTRLRITIESVGGGDEGRAGAVAGVGFREIDVGLGPTTEVVRPPIDVPEGLPRATVLTRQRVDPSDRWRSDPEPTLVREIELPDGRPLALDPTVRLDLRAPDSDIAALFGWPVSASTRLLGSVRNAGVAAFDGDPATTWMSAFGDGVGATLTIDDVQTPTSELTVTQPRSDLSRVTEVEIRVGDESRRVRVTPDASGTATLMLDPPVPAGDWELEVTAVAPTTTIDRRFGDVVDLPIAIGEIAFDGAPRTTPVGAASPVQLTCVPIGEIDGAPITADIAIDGSGWLDGAPLVTRPCEPEVRLDTGAHLVMGRSGIFQLDRLVLDGGIEAAATEAATRPVVQVLEAGRFGGRYEVSGCEDGCWFVFGEGVNEAWRADAGGDDLGPPSVLDGGFNGWWIAPSTEPVVVDVQTPLSVGLWASALAAALCIGLVLRGRRGVEVPPTVTVLDVDPPRLDRRPAIALGALWIVAGFLLIGPWGALWGLAAGVVLAVTRRPVLPALTALAAVCAIGLDVVVTERRFAPFPNGGWPSQFERLHDVGMFALAALLVAAFVPTRPVGSGVAVDERPVEDPVEDV
jgi:arabinofuranan 3-O-arabinosyltransferase